jgi:hypothetical protein
LNAACSKILFKLNVILHRCLLISNKEVQPKLM